MTHNHNTNTQSQANSPQLKYKAVIYDLDNTLLSTNTFVFELIKKTAQEVAKNISFEIPSDSFIKSIQKENLPFEEIFTKLFPNPIGYYNAEPLANLILARYRSTAKDLHFESTPQGNNVVKQLKQEGIIQGIVTNRVKMAQERLNQAGYIVPFEFLTAPQREEDRKPNPAVFREPFEILKIKGIGIKEIVSVGDHLDDFAACKNAGIRFCAVLTGLTTKEEFLAQGLETKDIFENLEQFKQSIFGE